MGAGISDSALRSRKRRSLLRIGRDLSKAGIATRYDAKLKAVVPYVDKGQFSIGYGGTSRASNAETFVPIVVTVMNPETRELERYSSLIDHNIFVRRVIALHSPKATAEEKADSYLAHLKYEIEQAFRVGDRKRNIPMDGGRWHARGDMNAGTFLFDDKGQRVEPDGGCLHCNVEHRNGRLFVTYHGALWMIQEPTPPASYHEFLPGYTIRDETGAIIVTRKA